MNKKCKICGYKILEEFDYYQTSDGNIFCFKCCEKYSGVTI